MADSELRQRKQPDAAEATVPAKKKPSKSKVDDEDAYSPWLDVLRVISFLFVASCALSYWISNGESFFWGMRNKPNYLRVDWWKAQWVRSPRLTKKPKKKKRKDGIANQSNSKVPST